MNTVTCLDLKGLERSGEYWGHAPSAKGFVRCMFVMPPDDDVDGIVTWIGTATKDRKVREIGTLLPGQTTDDVPIPDSDRPKR